MMPMPGDRVVLPRDKRDCLPEEHGELVGIIPTKVGMRCLVLVDEEYRDPHYKYDEGRRTCLPQEVRHER